MSITKKHFLLLPEIFLLLSILYYWILTGILFNPFAIILVVIMLYLIYSNNRILGIIISGLLIFINIYLILAMVSELSEFPTKTEAYYDLLIVGSFIFTINIIAAVYMFLKYFKMDITLFQKQFN
jgi:hypothetical protein